MFCFVNHEYCYFLQPYFGGAAQCEEGAVAEVKVEELICPPCSGPQIAQVYNFTFLGLMCRYCFICFLTPNSITSRCPYDVQCSFAVVRMVNLKSLLIQHCYLISTSECKKCSM